MNNYPLCSALLGSSVSPKTPGVPRCSCPECRTEGDTLLASCAQQNSVGSGTEKLQVGTEPSMLQIQDTRAPHHGLPSPAVHARPASPETNTEPPARTRSQPLPGGRLMAWAMSLPEGTRVCSQRVDLGDGSHGAPSRRLGVPHSVAADQAPLVPAEQAPRSGRAHGIRGFLLCPPSRRGWLIERRGGLWRTRAQRQPAGTISQGGGQALQRAVCPLSRRPL